MAYKALNKNYEVFQTPKDKQPCELCCFSREECYEIIDSEGFMACGCEFGGRYHCQ